MKTKLNFTKRFNKGDILEGITYNESINFVSVESANSWIAGVKKYAKRNGWTLIDYHFA